MKNFMMTKLDEQNKTVISKLDELIKVSSRKNQENQKPRSQPPAVNHNLEDDLYSYEEDYRWVHDFENFMYFSLSNLSFNSNE